MSLTTDVLKTLDRLLQQGLDLPQTERAAWIDALPPPQNTLAPLLRAHLLTVDSPTGIETADFPGALPTLPPSALEQNEPKGGERIGPYQLVRPLGEGGMSSVWLAERADGNLRRDVALKLPHRHLLDRGLAARMLRERNILASLNHDHIARLYDAGVDAEGRPYLALEYVEGAPINKFCDDTSLNLNGRIGLMVQVVRAVAYAHANLVVHRDLKPNNILVAKRDAAPVVKLLDFGIAKLLTNAEQECATQDLTQTLGRALTPDYASPEQLLDKPVTTASDIYSLGVLLYEVVTGEKPYKLKRQSAAALAEAVIHADVIRPSKRGAEAAGKHRQESRRIAGDLDAIILKALKPAPADRYATASALADDLERFLARRPVMAQPDSVAYRIRRLIQRHAIAMSAGAAVSLALIAGAGIALWQAQQARLETIKTKAVKDFLLSIVSVGNVDQQDALLRRRQPIGDVLLDAAKSMPSQFADQPEIRSELQGMLGTALADLSMQDSARIIQEARLAELTARGAALTERMQAQVKLAANLANIGDPKRSAQLVKEAIDALGGKSDGASRSVLAEALRTSSTGKVERFDGTSGVEDAARALAITEALEPGSKTHASTLSMLGSAHAHNRDLPNAELAFNKAILLAHALPASERAFEATVRLRYAESLVTARFHLRALKEMNEALAIIEQTSGQETFRWARTAVVTANLLSANGDAPRAIEMFERVLRVYEKFGNELDPLFASAAHALYAQCLTDYGQFAEAARVGALGFAPYRDVVDASAGAIWLAGTRYGLALQASGDYAQAEKVLSHALKVALAAGLSPGKSDLPNGQRLLALNDIYGGRHAPAQASLLKIISTAEVPVGRFINQRNFARLALARSYLAEGRLDDAEKEIGILSASITSIADDEIGFSRPAAGQLENLRGWLRLKRGDSAAATIHFQRGIDIIVARQHPQSPHLASARADLALALASKGERAKAKALADRARAAFATHSAVAPHLRQSLIAVDRLLKRP